MNSKDISWNPGRYLALGGHRLRPALDLLGRIPLAAPLRVVDLGCGAGNVTGYLRRRWPEAGIIGLDNSPRMLAAAAEQAPGIDWLEADLAGWKPESPVDVLYSNAALHWLPGHDSLLPRLAGYLAPGGVLAIQMPRNFEAPSHTVMYDVADNGPWSDKLARLGNRQPVAGPEFYHGLLAPLVQELDIWETEYLQVLSGDNPVADFTKGSWLKAMLDALDEPQKGEFEAEYRRAVALAYPRRADGSTLFPFKRLFIVATAPL